MRITNHTRETLDFIVRGKAKNGVAPTGSVAPGLTKDLDVDPNDPQLRGRLRSGAVSLSDGAADTAETGGSGPSGKRK